MAFIPCNTLEIIATPRDRTTAPCPARWPAASLGPAWWGYRAIARPAAPVGVDRRRRAGLGGFQARVHPRMSERFRRAFRRIRKPPKGCAAGMWRIAPTQGESPDGSLPRACRRTCPELVEGYAACSRNLCPKGPSAGSGLGQHERTSRRAMALGRTAYEHASPTEEPEAGKLHVRVHAGRGVTGVPTARGNQHPHKS